MKILIADDERWVRKGIKKMINTEGLDIEEIMEAGSVEEAMMIFRKSHPEIVVSDVCFPIDDGCNLCRKIYEIDSQVKFIMLSGYDDFMYVRQSLAFRAVDYLLKPVDKNVLNKTIRKAWNELRKENGELNPDEKVVISSVCGGGGIVNHSGEGRCREKLC